MAEDTHITNIETRVTRTESEINSLQKDVADLAHNVEALGVKVDQGFQSIVKQISERNKTPWGIIISAAGVLLAFTIALATMGASGPLKDLERLWIQNKEVTASIIDHLKDGHPLRVEQKVDRNITDIDDLNKEIDQIARLVEANRRDVQDRWTGSNHERFATELNRRLVGIENDIIRLEKQNK